MKKERYFSAEYSTHTVYAEPYKCNWIPGQYFEPLSGKVFSHNTEKWFRGRGATHNSKFICTHMNAKQ